MLISNARSKEISSNSNKQCFRKRGGMREKYYLTLSFTHTDGWYGVFHCFGRERGHCCQEKNGKIYSHKYYNSCSLPPLFPRMLLSFSRPCFYIAVKFNVLFLQRVEISRRMSKKLRIRLICLVISQVFLNLRTVLNLPQMNSVAKILLKIVAPIEEGFETAAFERTSNSRSFLYFWRELLRNLVLRKVWGRPCMSPLRTVKWNEFWIWGRYQSISMLLPQQNKTSSTLFSFWRKSRKWQPKAVLPQYQI